ncbi:hypothetical protein [Halococcus sediminicola]|nr:hypothetical protein [Halococcus sediminicola]
MTDDIHSFDDGEQRPNDTQHAVETCKHATDALDPAPQDSA